MRSIQRRFKKIQLTHPELYSIVCFNNAITGQNFSKDRIARWFNKLVDKEDYSTIPKKHCLAHCYNITKSTVAYEKPDQTSSYKHLK
jgi:hypothetical protein